MQDLSLSRLPPVAHCVRRRRHPISGWEHQTDRIRPPPRLDQARSTTVGHKICPDPRCSTFGNDSYGKEVDPSIPNCQNKDATLHFRNAYYHKRYSISSRSAQWASDIVRGSCRCLELVYALCKFRIKAKTNRTMNISKCLKRGISAFMKLSHLDFLLSMRSLIPSKPCRFH